MTKPSASIGGVSPCIYADARMHGLTSLTLGLLADWLDQNPEGLSGKWFKRLPGMTVCGEGDLVNPKTEVEDCLLWGAHSSRVLAEASRLSELGAVWPILLALPPLPVMHKKGRCSGTHVLPG